MTDEERAVWHRRYLVRMAEECGGDKGETMRKRKPYPVNRRAHRLVMALDEAVKDSGMTMGEMATKAGFQEKTLWRWRNAVSVPNVLDMERALDAVGYRIVLVSKGIST